MTMEEASVTYGIPVSVLREYERWGLCKEADKTMGAWRYDRTDIERLSLIMTLHDAGFSNGEAKRYMQLFLLGEEAAGERLEMLRSKRSGTLDELHRKQKQLDRLDYLLFKTEQQSKK